jgi:hypothetical protein
MAKTKQPRMVRLGGINYHATVYKVVARDDDGSPRTFELLRDHESTGVEQGDEFWVTYTSERVLNKTRN